jgi:hypothetical protein
MEEDKVRETTRRNRYLNFLTTKVYEEIVSSD